VSSVARRLGIAPATLRTWDRRYGLGPADHEMGEHRRYSAGDLARLTMMRRLISEGMAPGDAAKMALTHHGEFLISTLAEEKHPREELVLALYSGATYLDAAFIEEGLRAEIGKSGVIGTWQEVLVPLLQMVGETWGKTGKNVEVEHLLTEIIKRTLRFVEVKDPVNPHPVLLAAVGDEQHTLPLKALAAALAERQIQVHLLGARTPLDALISIVKKTAPPAIFLWAQMSQHADAKFFRDIPTIRPAPRIILGGPGWAGIDHGASTYLKDLPTACQEIMRAVGFESPR
jgi:transposase-like protein